MEITITLAISIIGCVLSISNFAINRKDKSNKDVGEEKYQQGMLDEKLKNIMEKLDKIEKKLDTQENEFKKIVEDEMAKHIAIYHQKG